MSKSNRVGIFDDPSKGILFGSKDLRQSFIKDIVSKTNNELYDQDFDTRFSGSTLVFALITDKLITCGNVGDSRLVIASYKNDTWFSANLTKDHKPELMVERERIINSGGRVSPFKNMQGEYIGPNRVWKKDANYPGLAMSRSMGDRAGQECGVIEEPEIKEKELTKEDKAIILGSDGIWEVISSKEAVRLIIPFQKDNDSQGACKKLLDVALTRWRLRNGPIDDITCIVLFIDPK